MRAENLRQGGKYIGKEDGITYTIDHISKLVNGSYVTDIVVFHKTGFYTAAGTMAMKLADFTQRFEKIVEETVVEKAKGEEDETV